LAQNPDLILLDEPESGVDLENMALVGNTIATLLEKNGKHQASKPRAQARSERKKMGLIITMRVISWTMFLPIKGRCF
jgi:Fe-S cluster assembly ATP-binding protein